MISSTEANKKLERLEQKKQKIEQELQEAMEAAKEAERFEKEASETGTAILNAVEITDKTKFINWLTQNTDNIPGVKRRNNAVVENDTKVKSEKPEAEKQGGDINVSGVR